jgi:hypothetical protein
MTRHIIQSLILKKMIESVTLLGMMLEMMLFLLWLFYLEIMTHQVLNLNI